MYLISNPGAMGPIFARTSSTSTQVRVNQPLVTSACFCRQTGRRFHDVFPLDTVKEDLGILKTACVKMKKWPYAAHSSDVMS